MFVTVKEYLIAKQRLDLIEECLNPDIQNNSKYASLNEIYNWKCKHGHTWSSTLKKRIAGRGCPVCTGRVVQKGVNDLTSQHPHLIKEWDYEKNGELLPENVSASNGRTIWWICERKHSWKDTVNHRADGRGCPICANKKIMEGENDFATTHPYLLAEWDNNKNTIKPNQVVGGSNKKVWWLCNDCEHSYEASLVNRTRFNLKCPKCKNKK